MEMRVKLETQDNTNLLHRQINFNINQLREDTRKLLINEDNEERIAIENLAKNLETAKILPVPTTTNSGKE